MSWQEVRGHDQNIALFRRSLERNRLASTFLFVGPEGVGKRKFALELAKCLFCENHEEFEFVACDSCPQCLQVKSGNHPDLIQISRPAGKERLPIGIVRGGDDYGPGLCHDISLKPFHGGRKIAILDDADFFSTECANALLKTLEEPPPESIMILLGTSEQQQLPTIRSRSQIVRFHPLPAADVAAILRELKLDEGVDIERLAPAAAGSIQRALLLRAPELYEFRIQFLEQLSTLIPIQNDFQKSVVTFLGNKDSEAALRRDRLRFLTDLAIEFFGALYECVLNQQISGPQDQAFQSAVEAAASRWSAPLTCLSTAIERTDELYPLIDAYISPANMICPWLADLTSLAQGKSLVPISF